MDKIQARGDMTLSRRKNNKEMMKSKEDYYPTDPLIEFYGLSDDFPRLQFMTRGGPSGDGKVIYFLGKSVKDWIDRGLQDRVKVINAGLKAFERNATTTNEDPSLPRYRICQEGIHYVAPYMTKRKISCSLKDFQICLDEKPVRLEKLSTDTASVIRKWKLGGFVVILEGFENDLTRRKMILVMWRGRGDSCNCLVSKVEKEGIRSKLRAFAEEQGKELQTTTETTEATAPKEAIKVVEPITETVPKEATAPKKETALKEAEAS
eukprot:CAMPEP_0116867796 /NCGR_PEP_ID=MMETSP0418-20121206/26826_1 /TAXON_ID=1158023 /ORGANISM="Astrosyne radiata, Strain 13vi08-1A" /LENGTH=263 /DNA_ID=CAMNT_0004503667 /DNA_START=35 /DNA_END=827 /DNA_ORIENTATION=+